MKSNKKPQEAIFKLGIVKGQPEAETTIEHFIFGDKIECSDVNKIEEHIDKYIKQLIDKFRYENCPDLNWFEFVENYKLIFHIYLTNSSAITASIIQICKHKKSTLKLYHYNQNTGYYQWQLVFL